MHINVLPPILAEAKIDEIIQGETKWFSKAMQHKDARTLNSRSSFKNALELVNEGTITHGLCFPYQFSCPQKSSVANNYLVKELNMTSAKLAGLITLQPSSETSRREAISLISNPKILGVKMKPQWGNFSLNDFEKLGFIYEELSKTGKFLLTHVTQNFHSSRGDGVSELFSLLSNFPNLRVIGAHMAGFISVYSDYSPVKKHLDNLFIDISLPANLRWLPHMMTLHDEEKFLYATDYPYIEHENFDELLTQGGLTDDQFEKITQSNPKKFLNNIWPDLL